ncbi:copper amine oxidase N-terminal domain-containing protein [Cohnella algarum]|nr:copper amine oxidase N-terminal domain-containing protein [Cohnella algarum]
MERLPVLVQLLRLRNVVRRHRQAGAFGTKPGSRAVEQLERRKPVRRRAGREQLSRRQAGGSLLRLERGAGRRAESPFRPIYLRACKELSGNGVLFFLSALQRAAAGSMEGDERSPLPESARAERMDVRKAGRASERESIQLPDRDGLDVRSGLVQGLVPLQAGRQHRDRRSDRPGRSGIPDDEGQCGLLRGNAGAPVGDARVDAGRSRPEHGNRVCGRHGCRCPRWSVLSAPGDDELSVPAKEAAQAIGASVLWDPETKTISLTLGSRIAKLQIGRAEAEIDGQSVPLAYAPSVVGGTALLPLRSVCEALGLPVATERPDEHTVRFTIDLG